MDLPRNEIILIDDSPILKQTNKDKNDQPGKKQIKMPLGYDDEQMLRNGSMIDQKRHDLEIGSDDDSDEVDYPFDLKQSRDVRQRMTFYQTQMGKMADGSQDEFTADLIKSVLTRNVSKFEIDNPADGFQR